jgi:hypothetical protein
LDEIFRVEFFYYVLNIVYIKKFQNKFFPKNIQIFDFERQATRQKVVPRDFDSKWKESPVYWLFVSTRIKN